MTWIPTRPASRAFSRPLALGSLGALLIVAACLAPSGDAGPTPTEPLESASPLSGAEAASPRNELASTPAFTPMTVRPRILNESEVMREMQRAYPALLRDAGIGGTATVYFFVDERGRVGNAVLAESSGYAPLDEAALRVARAYRFEPARNRDEVVPVWIQFPVTFRTGGAPDASPEAPAAVAREPRVAATGDAGRTPGSAGALDPSAGPTFTPFTVRPRILNEREIVREMQREVPPLLRDAGIGGTVIVLFFIDAEGRVGDARVHQSSGYEPLDQAALRVARAYRFEPARNRDGAVAVWVSFPLTFRVNPE